MTRVIQFCWLITGISHFLCEYRLFYCFDSQFYLSSGGRRLQRMAMIDRRCGIQPTPLPPAPRGLAALSQAGSALGVAPLEVEWPYGEFFRPEKLSCMSRGPVSGSAGLFVGSRHLLYDAAVPSPDAAVKAPRRLWLEALPRDTHPPNSTALCAQTKQGEALQCLMAEVAVGGKNVAFWPMGSHRHGSESVEVPVSGGKPWLHMSGTAMRCSDVAGLGSSVPEAAAGAWCLLLVGWDGERLPVAVVPLPRGPTEAPSVGTTIVSDFDAPLLPRRSDGTCVSGREGACRSAGADDEVATMPEEVLSMHVEPSRTRLWALLAGGELQAWDLASPRSLGRWPLYSSQTGDFRATAVCEGDSSQGLLVTGASDLGGPELFRVEIPTGLDGSGTSRCGRTSDGTASPIN